MPAHNKDDMTYIVVEDFGSLGRAYLETDERLADRNTTIINLIEGQSDRPLRIVAFDAKACDVSADIAQEIIDRAWTMDVDLPPAVINFCERHGAEVPEIIRERSA